MTKTELDEFIETEVEELKTEIEAIKAAAEKSRIVYLEAICAVEDCLARGKDSERLERVHTAIAGIKAL